MDLVTPEAVALDLREATVATRTLAYLVDIALQALLVVVVLLGADALDVGSAFAGLPDWVGVVTAVVLTFVLLWGYPVGFETLMHGRTPGKAALGLRVVTREGAPERLRHAALRAVFLTIDVYGTSGALGALSMVLTRRHQRVGDLIAGTVVVRERVPQRSVGSRPVGTEDDALLDRIDASGLGPSDLGAATTFLQRAPGMAPAPRADLAARLAERLAARTASAPPAGMAPERYVALVVAAARRTWPQQASAGGAGPGTGPGTGPAKPGGPQPPPDDGFAAPG